MNYRAVIPLMLGGLFSPSALAQLVISPSSLTFATQTLFTTSAKKQINVKNGSNTSVSFSSISTTGDFSATGTCRVNSPLAAGATCYLKVGFTPTAIGTRTGVLTLVDSDPGSPQQVPLTGIGTEVSFPSSIIFGTQLLNTTSAPTPVVLGNVGSTVLTITAIAITGDFQVQGQNCIPQGSSTGRVNPGTTCTIEVVFAPTTVFGKRTGSLTVTDNGGGATQSVALTGTATAVLLSTSSLAFGSQYLRLPSAVHVVSVSNVSSTTSFNVTGISLNASDYSQVSSCIPVGQSSGKVLPNNSCAIYVTFKPLSTGSRPGTMSISTNGGGSPQSVALGGTGIGGVGVALRPRVAAITDTEVQQLTATVTNATNTTVTWLVDGVLDGNSTVGTITVTGLNTAVYTPPPIPPNLDGPHTVTATSLADSTRSGSIVVTVTDYPGTLTYHNDNARDGQNQREIVLNPSNVNVAQFGKLFSYALDGQVYAQPLYVANVNIPGQGYHNVLYVATEHDSVYAFDADGLTTAPLWQVSFLKASQNVTTVPSSAILPNYSDIFPEIGITGTPVIDPSTGTLYVVAKTDDNGTYAQRLHALNIATGAEQANNPVVISGSINTQGHQVVFDPLLQNQRAALLLLNGVVYIAWGSHGDIGTYHGWVMGYDARTLAQVNVYLTTPTGAFGGIWQAGGGPVADASGKIYVTSGNGKQDAPSGGSDYGGCFIKLSNQSGALAVADYFVPNTGTDLNDHEMSSGGPILLPDQSGIFPHIAIVAAKDTNIYMVNRDNMGGANPSSSQLLQTVTAAFKGGVFSTPSFWQNNVYFWAATDILRSFQLRNGLLSSTATFPLFMRFPGSGTSVSSHGAQNGILWALDARAVLHAFDATNVYHEFYNSLQAGTRDNAGTPVKFTVPTVANGKVYVGSANQVTAYGLLP
jgi:hypothetical protein